MDANDNGSFGATLSSSSADVTVYTGSFNSNSSFGLSLSAVDQVGLTDVAAGDNGAFGATLSSSAGPVWIDNGSLQLEHGLWPEASSASRRRVPGQRERQRQRYISAHRS